MIFTRQRYLFLLILVISLAFHGAVIPSTYADNHPTAAITYSESGPYKSGDEITITATFSEAVAESPVPKIAITGANTVSATVMTKTSTTVYTYAHTVAAGNGNASVVMSVAKDAGGNVVIATPTSGATFVVDNTDPTAAITYSRSGQYEKNDTVTITATFSEAVAESPVPKIAITGANAVSATVMTKTSTTVYTYAHTVDHGSGNASVVMSVAKDVAGNTIIATPTSGATFVVDNKSSFQYPPHIHDEVTVSINSDDTFVLDVKDTDITNISANVGDTIKITISVGDDKIIEKISQIKLITNFAKKPSDMNNYFANNTLEGQTGLSVYEFNQKLINQSYSYGEILTWNDATMIKRDRILSNHDDVGPLLFDEQELLIKYSMIANNVGEQTPVMLKVMDDVYLQTTVVLPFTLEILPNLAENSTEELIQEIESLSDDKSEFFIKSDKSVYVNGNKVVITGQIPIKDFDPTQAKTIKFSITSPENEIIIAGEFMPQLDGSFRYDTFAMDTIWKTDGDYIFNFNFKSITSDLIIFYDNTEFQNLNLQINAGDKVAEPVVTPPVVTPPVVTPPVVTPPVVTPPVVTPPVVTPPVVTPPVVEQKIVEKIIPKCGTGTESVNGICQVIQTSLKSDNGGGCLIATATYDSEMSNEVQQLRELRDNQLLQTESGKQFMGMFNDIYYSFSPIIADYERENPLFKQIVKLAITPMISTLSLMENANSESEVLGLGLSVIMLNLGMYLAVPAVVIVGIRKKI